MFGQTFVNWTDRRTARKAYAVSAPGKSKPNMTPNETAAAKD